MRLEAEFRHEVRDGALHCLNVTSIELDGQILAPPEDDRNLLGIAFTQNIKEAGRMEFEKLGASNHDCRHE